MTLWKGGDDLIKTVVGNCSNTVVVIHGVGAVLVDEWYDHPNVTGIIWAGLPGQESGSSLADVLYGRVNPGGKTPFTWGKTREAYGPPLITEPNNGELAPQAYFPDGIFIDYRRFDKYDETPIYEFGFGLSYTNFSYSDLKVEQLDAPPYTPTTGWTSPAPTFGTVGPASDYLYPDNIERPPLFLFPYINSTDLAASSNDSTYGMKTSDYIPEGALDTSPQPLLPAGGAPGGNPRLYDQLFRISITITNTGSVIGDEVPQLYVSLGGPDDSKVALRAFDRLTIQPGESVTWTPVLTRRDLSNWDPASQDWFISEYPKTAFAGSSSRKLPLSAPLPI